jgi:hypothetical protein
VGAKLKASSDCCWLSLKNYMNQDDDFRSLTKGAPSHGMVTRTTLDGALSTSEASTLFTM